MSRIGKKPILIPENVEVKIEGQKVLVKGPKGELSTKISPEIKVEIKEGNIFVLSQAKTKKDRALWGLYRALLYNTIEGVTKGYEKKLQIEGVGFKANIEGDTLVLQLGFSHPVKIKAAEGIKFSVEKNIINVSGIDKQLVSQTAADIRKIKKPEPYKGKGIRYFGEVIKKKLGKKAVGVGK